MKIERVWAMSNKETFKIKPIKELISRYIDSGVWVDPFVRNSIFKDKCKLTNDLDPKIKADYNLEALDFLNTIESNSVDGLLFDPPYSPRQIKESYNGIGIRVFQKDTNSSFYSLKKDEISRIMKLEGIVISFGWNSVGLGINRGFKIIEILLICHGSAKNDTIVTVEKKVSSGSNPTLSAK